MTLLSVNGLGVSLPGPRGRVQVLDDLALEIEPGETLGVVGESGSGKSMTALAIMRLLPAAGRIETGAIRLGGDDLVTKPDADMRGLRGRSLAMIFQEPMRSLNPLLRVGFQIGEAYETHFGCSRSEAREKAIEMLRTVGLPSPESQADRYPHELSGGMRQRVTIAMAIALEPKLLIADEPTTALDVTIQAQILRLLSKLGRERQMGVLLITHDLGVVARMATRVVVMYAGQVVEDAPVDALFAEPRHPYTALLMRAVPRVVSKLGRLEQIAGTAPPPAAWPKGCRFHPRCPAAIARCRAEAPPLETDDDGHAVRCWRANEKDLLP